MGFYIQCSNFRVRWPIKQMLGALSVFLLLGVTALRAEMIVEQNKIFIGNDYSVFTLKAGEHKRCRQACAKDKRCLAWTLVKPGGVAKLAECRLKREIGRSFSNKCCVSGRKKTDFRAGQGNQKQRRRVELCDKWAAEAVRLSTINERRGCGYRGRAWNVNERRYFRRCMKLGPKELRAEQRGQKQAINVCLAELDSSKKARCDHYARIAVTQNASRIKARCAAGQQNRWNKNYKVHYNYCLKNDLDEINKAQNARERLLERCYAFQVVKDSPCHKYAEAAISHFRKNVQKGCDLHGPLWHNNYRRHVSHCRQMSAKQRSRELNKRKVTLKTCRLFGKFGIKWN